MKGKASIRRFGDPEVKPAVHCEIEASTGDFGRGDNPTISATIGDLRFFFEFSSPDHARQLGEKLFHLARHFEDKYSKRGKEYRDRLAREEFMTNLQDAVGRLEKAIGGPVPSDLAPFFQKPIASLSSNDGANLHPDHPQAKDSGKM